MFVQNLEGTLMELAEAPETRYRYVIWFDYTRRGINSIREGALVAVPNFGGDGITARYSVLEVAAILPMHYALQGGTTGYPGFVVEAARSAAEDWEAQADEATEETTKIRVVAIPTNLEIVESLNVSQLDGTARIEPESNVPMVGSKVRILDTEYSNLIANNGIDREHEENLTVIGAMVRDRDVDVLLRIDELYRTHFALFGFTGVGKSNLLSTIVAKVLHDADAPVKLVFFDLMGEYTGLLIDQCLNDDINAGIISVGRHTLPEGVFSYINDLPNRADLRVATQQLQRYTLLPKALLRHRPLMSKALSELIACGRLRFFHESQNVTVYELFFSDGTPWGKDRRGANIQRRKDVVKDVLRPLLPGGRYDQHTFSPDLARRVREGLQHSLDADGTFSEDFAPILERLSQIAQAISESYAAAISIDDLVTDINNPGHSSLWILQSHNPNDLREFSRQLGDRVYEARRQQGLVEPLASFVFDEADEFIPGNPRGSYQASADIAETLARRGRKFGLGIGIATQRIRNLSTNIMSQPHTYFISKLPRQSDRQAVAEAFGVSDELLNQTFKFQKGEWLLMSHGATGLEAVPIPIRTPNANERIAEWLTKRYGSVPTSIASD